MLDITPIYEKINSINTNINKNIEMVGENPLECYIYIDEIEKDYNKLLYYLDIAYILENISPN